MTDNFKVRVYMLDLISFSPNKAFSEMWAIHYDARRDDLRDSRNRLIDRHTPILLATGHVEREQMTPIKDFFRRLNWDVLRVSKLVSTYGTVIDDEDVTFSLCGEKRHRRKLEIERGTNPLGLLPTKDDMNDFRWVVPLNELLGRDRDHDRFRESVSDLEDPDRQVAARALFTEGRFGIARWAHAPADQIITTRFKTGPTLYGPGIERDWRAVATLTYWEHCVPYSSCGKHKVTVCLKKFRSTETRRIEICPLYGSNEINLVMANLSPNRRPSDQDGNHFELHQRLLNRPPDLPYSPENAEGLGFVYGRSLPEPELPELVNAIRRVWRGDVSPVETRCGNVSG